MHVGVISDTHDHRRNVRRAIEIFNDRGVKYVLHAGDIVSASTVELFAGLRDSKLVAVFGNCDIDRVSLASAIEAVGGEVHRDRYQGRLDGLTIFMTHKPETVGQAVEGGTCDLVIHGHTHRQAILRMGTALIVNPGAATNWMGQPGHVVVLDTADMTTNVESLG